MAQASLHDPLRLLDQRSPGHTRATARWTTRWSGLVRNLLLLASGHLEWHAGGPLSCWMTLRGTSGSQCEIRDTVCKVHHTYVVAKRATLGSKDESIERNPATFSRRGQQRRKNQSHQRATRFFPPLVSLTLFLRWLLLQLTCMHRQHLC